MKLIFHFSFWNRIYMLFRNQYPENYTRHVRSNRTLIGTLYQWNNYTLSVTNKKKLNSVQEGRIE